MKSFIKYTISFLLPILLLAYPLDIFISTKLRQSHKYYGEFEVWNDIYEGDIDADMLIYGSSRAWVDISPKILDDSLHLYTYNLGIDGHNFWLQYLRHLEYLKYNEAPKYIILAVDYNSLSKRDDLYLYEQFLPYMLWNENIKKFTKSYNGYNNLEYSVPLIRYFGERSALQEILKMSLIRKPENSYRSNGYKGIDKKWSQELNRAKKQMSSYKILLDADSVELLERFLSECIKNNIEVTIVYTPEYIEGQNFIEDRYKIINLYQSYANEFNLNFLDYSENKISYNKDFFYNATHLNKKGSEVFSKILVQDLLEIDAKHNLK